MTEKLVPDMVQISEKYYKDPDFRKSIDAAMDPDTLKTFKTCMASARLMWDIDYYKALRDEMGRMMYKALKGDKSK